MNSVQLLGNLARDPEVRYTQSGRAVATFTIAASNTYAATESNFDNFADDKGNDENIPF
jgi:single-strand DNA-binding protein